MTTNPTNPTNPIAKAMCRVVAPLAAAGALFLGISATTPMLAGAAPADHSVEAQSSDLVAPDVDGDIDLVPPDGDDGVDGDVTPDLTDQTSDLTTDGTDVTDGTDGNPDCADPDDCPKGDDGVVVDGGPQGHDDRAGIPVPRRIDTGAGGSSGPSAGPAMAILGGAALLLTAVAVRRRFATSPTGTEERR